MIGQESGAAQWLRESRWEMMIACGCLEMSEVRWALPSKRVDSRAWQSEAPEQWTRFSVFFAHHNPMHMKNRMIVPCLLLVSLSSTAQVSGDPDLTFSGDGVAAIDFASNHDDRGSCILVQPDGRILVGGGSHQGNGTKFGLARLMPDGTLDATFGSAGRVATQVGAPPSLDETFYALALQPDGKIVAVGRSYAGTGYRAAVLRYNSNGTLDPTFSSDGIQVDDLAPGTDDGYFGVAIQPDGRIVVAGVAKGTVDYDAVVVRYTAAGALDATFNTTGIAKLDIGAVDNRASAMVLQPDGKIVIAGQTGNASIDSDYLLARFTADGQLDATFGTNGTVVSAFGPSTDWAYALALQPDGRLVAAGMVINGTAASLAVARYTTAGALDPSFGTAGLALNEFSASCFARSVALLQDGRIAAVGNSALSMFVTVFTAIGTLDTGFSSDGSTIVNVGGGNAFGYAVAVQADGKLLAGGQAVQGGAQNNYIVARFHAGVNIGLDELAVNATALQLLPNPADDALELRYALKRGERITITVVDAQGRAARIPFNGAWQAPGEQRLRISLSEISSPGAYTIVVAGEQGVLGSARFVRE